MKRCFFIAMLAASCLYADSSYLFKSHPDKFIPSDIDSEIHSRVNAALQGGQNIRSYAYINVEVNAGNITLKGSVPTQQDYRNVMNRVSMVKGVKNIDNQITVIDTESH